MNKNSEPTIKSIIRRTGYKNYDEFLKIVSTEADFIMATNLYDECVEHGHSQGHLQIYCFKDKVNYAAIANLFLLGVAEGRLREQAKNNN